MAVVVGLLCLNIGFGIWWNYFDFVGSRKRRPGRGIRGVWLIVHLPLSLSIAATGAGMVSLIEHANEDRTGHDRPARSIADEVGSRFTDDILRRVPLA